MRRLIAKLVVALAVVTGVGAVVAAPAAAAPHLHQAQTQHVRPADWSWN